MTHEPECFGTQNIHYSTSDCPICECIRAAYKRGREDAEQLIRNLHREIPYKAMDGTPSPECACCDYPYPCPTIKALDVSEGGEQE